MKPLITLLLLATMNVAFCQNTAREKYSATEVREDLSFLYKTLEASHYNLYVNTSKKVFDAEYKRLTGSIKDSMTILECHRLFQPFSALSGLGHCNIAYPFSPAYVNYVMNKGTLFPFNVSITDRRLFITANYSQDSSIHTGDQILSINTISASNYMNKIYKYLSGESEYLKNTQLDMLLFSRVNWFVYDRQDEYALKIKHSSGKISSITVKAIPAMEYEGAASKNKPITTTAREFKFIGDIAYLRPGVFMNVEGSTNISDHKSLEKGWFSYFMDSCFALIRKSNTKDLIIDLRGNPGGDNSFSDEMISYFANKPFSFYSKFYVRTSAVTKGFWKDIQDKQLEPLKKLILENEDGKIVELPGIKTMPKPDSLQYKGNVYILIDRYSYSNAVTSAALIQDYKFGTIVGEQTADSPTTYAAIHQFNLPSTQLTVAYPKASIIRPNGDKAVKGVVPDIRLKEIYSTEADEILDNTVKIITRKK